MPPPASSARVSRPSRARRALERLAGPLAARPVASALGLGAALSLLVGALAAEAVPTEGGIMPLSEVKAGMKGYGLTVFSGTKPEKFDVEVISTLKNFRPNQDLVLIKTPNHPRLDAARTVAGMSGSPIYLNGRMIGAYAYGWLFGVEAIAGVTPIQSMIDDGNRPIPKRLLPKGASPLPSAGALGVTFGNRQASFDGSVDSYDLGDHAKQIAQQSAPMLKAPEGTPLARASTPILMGGMPGGAIKIASDLFSPMGLEPLQAGGGGGKTDPNAPTRFEDGGAIGVELVRGDISAMGLGTVTRVTGNKVLAFGHPMLGGGVENLPTAIARVHWILASQNRSFKIGEAVRPLGALVNDRQSAIIVDQGAKAPTFPMRVQIEGVPGAPKSDWKVEVAHDQFMAPAFTAMALGSAVETTAAERNDTTWRAMSKLKLGKYGTVSFYDYASGNGSPAGPDDFVRSRLVRAMGMLLNNPWEDVRVEGIETTLKMTYERETMTLKGAKLVESEIDAGKPARVRLELQPFQGKSIVREIAVPIPVELAGRKVDIDIAPGYSVEKPKATPENVSELIQVLEDATFDPESVVATVKLREVGAAFNGRVASRLPPGAVDTLRPTTDSDAPETFASEVHTAVPLKRFLIGKDSVSVQVRPVLR